MIFVHYVLPAIHGRIGKIPGIPGCFHNDYMVGVRRTDYIVCVIVDIPKHGMKLVCGIAGAVAVSTVRLIQQIVSRYSGIAGIVLRNLIPDVIEELLVVVSVAAKEEFRSTFLVVSTVHTGVVAAVLRTGRSVEIQNDIHSPLSCLLDKPVDSVKAAVNIVAVKIHKIHIPERKADTIDTKRLTVIKVLSGPVIVLIYADKFSHPCFAKTCSQGFVNIQLACYGIIIIAVFRRRHPKFLYQIPARICSPKSNDVAVSVIVAKYGSVCFQEIRAG